MKWLFPLGWKQNLCAADHRGVCPQAGQQAPDQCLAQLGVEGFSQRGGFHHDGIHLSHADGSASPHGAKSQVQTQNSYLGRISALTAILNEARAKNSSTFFTFISYPNINIFLASLAFRDLVFTPAWKSLERPSMRFCTVSINVNKAETGQTVISGPDPPAFTTDRGRGNVREAVSPGYGQLPLLRLITLGPGCQRWWGEVTGWALLMVELL